MRNHAKVAAACSAVLMGLGQFYNRQYAKGVMFFAVEAIGVYFFFTRMLDAFADFITLGEVSQGFQKINGKFVTVQGDHSIFMMIYGLVALCSLFIIAVIYALNIRDAYYNGKLRNEGKAVANFGKSLRNVYNNGFPYLFLSIPAIGVLFFTILPIIFMVLMAFTNYSAPNHIPPKGLVDWVGFSTFKDLLFLKQWAHTFYGVLTWTIIWAITATVTCYFGGILVAILIQQKGIKFKGLWRTIFILPYAIPQFISFLILRNMLNYQFGPVNDYLRFFGLGGVPWLNDPFWAKVTVILVNMWVGIPVTMVLVIGLLGNIPRDLYEAAEVDGATGAQQFRHITMPYVLFSTAPILIMQFAGNINNFNVIFLMTNGDPKTGDYAYAGTTDLLVTWLYKLTLDNSKYNVASAIGIIIFLIIASFSIYNYRKTKSFKEEDMMQ